MEGKALKSVLDFAVAAMNECTMKGKVDLTLKAYKLWKEGKLSVREKGKSYKAPQKPGRPKHFNVVPPSKTGKRGKGGSLSSRIALIHSFAHIESYAIDLSWDIMLRFNDDTSVNLPDSFFGDWLKVAWDEARHYSMWAERLVELGSEYGKLPVHDGLWQSALESKDSLMNRLAIIHMVHEARGLDVTPKSIQRLKSGGDPKSATLLKEIYEDEITHVEAGVKWFKYLCTELKNEPIPTFHKIVKKNFRGPLKPPFNHEGREKAGFTKKWYLPLTVKKATSASREIKST